LREQITQHLRSS